MGRQNKPVPLTLHVGKEKMNMLSYNEPNIKMVSWKKLDLVRVEILRGGELYNFCMLLLREEETS